MNNQVKEATITVVTACYNNWEQVIATLECVQKQTYAHIQHIVIDDGSSNDSFERLQQWITNNEYDCLLQRNSRNIGICATLNRALEQAEGRFLCVNCDDYWEPYHLERSLEILVESKADVIYSSTRICKPDGSLLFLLEDMLTMRGYTRQQELLPPGKAYFMLNKAEAIDALFYLNFIHVITAMVPVKWLKENGGFDESIPFEDYDLAFRICGQLNVCFNRTFAATYFKHERSYTMDPKRAVSLNLGTIKTLSKYRNLITREDTRQKYEQLITTSCLTILEANPRMLFKLITTYKAAVPWKSWKETAAVLLKKLYMLRSVLLPVAIA